jgi:hypothetical protein
MKTTEVALIAFLVNISAAGAADDAQDALELLTYSLKCPLKPKVERATEGTATHTVQKFSGDKSVFRVEETITRVGDMERHNVFTAAFSRLGSVSVLGDKDENPSLLLTCAGPQIRQVPDGPLVSRPEECITAKIDSSNTFQSGPRTAASLSACDLETANHIKLGIEILIKLNKKKSERSLNRTNTPQLMPSKEEDDRGNDRL